MRKSSFKIITLVFCFFLFGNLNSSFFKDTNRIKLNVINETDYEISKLKVSYTFGATKMNNTLAPNQNINLTINPSIVRKNNKNDPKIKMHLSYFCDEKLRVNKISISVRKWKIIDKGWEIRIQNRNLIELKEL